MWIECDIWTVLRHRGEYIVSMYMASGCLDGRSQYMRPSGQMLALAGAGLHDVRRRCPDMAVCGRVGQTAGQRPYLTISAAGGFADASLSSLELVAESPA